MYTFNSRFYIFAIFAITAHGWMFASIYYGYPDPVMLICAGIFFVGGLGFLLCAYAFGKDPVVVYIEDDDTHPDDFIWNQWKRIQDEPAYLRRQNKEPEQLELPL